jgi:hypothetical protein
VIRFGTTGTCVLNFIGLNSPGNRVRPHGASLWAQLKQVKAANRMACHKFTNCDSPFSSSLGHRCCPYRPLDSRWNYWWPVYPPTACRLQQTLLLLETMRCLRSVDESRVFELTDESWTRLPRDRQDRSPALCRRRIKRWRGRIINPLFLVLQGRRCI